MNKSNAKKTVFVTTIAMTGLFMLLYISDKSTRWNMKMHVGSILQEHGRKKDGMREMEEEQRKRQRQIWKSCKKLKMTNSLPEDDDKFLRVVNKTRLYYSDKFKVVGCWIPKAGSTNFKKLFLAAEGFTDVDSSRDVKSRDALVFGNKMRLGSINDANEIRYRLDNYFKVIMVRDPASRVLSAFTSKFGNSGSAQSFQRWSRKIHKDYSNDSSPLTFEEFVHYVTDKTKQRNVHWEYFHTLCLPCSVNYNFVAKIENSSKELKCFKDIVGLTKYSYPEKSDSSMRTKEDRFAKYYKGKQYLLDEIYTSYKVDYDIFGYSGKYEV